MLIYIARIGLFCHIGLVFLLLSDTGSACLHKYICDDLRDDLLESNDNVRYYVYVMTSIVWRFAKTV